MRKEITKEDRLKWSAKGGKAKGRSYKKKMFLKRSKELSLEERFDLGTAPFDEPINDE